MTKNTTNNKKYIVTRDGSFVSDFEYNSPEDASEELSYWKKLTTKWDPTSKVEIVEKQK